MFDTLLVANRGEIACRIIRTAERMGLKTVAVFSDPDRAAPHVRMADLAVRLGPAPARDSYLLVDRVLDAALSTGAGAVHPGYGFLSEDAGFATAVEEAGLAFVGPTPAQLTAFGAKHTARSLAQAAGVPMIDGTGLLSGLDEALDAAERIGYPVMVKATGGGGGIGMQACHSSAELIAAYDRVERMAVASFGSGGVFLERFVQRARHVEVQVFGDGADRVVVLGDRDCSLQRRNQKVIEEAPAPGLPDAVRELLHTSAAALCAGVDYRSAGTVEFVYDAEREQASFLEVNARLQVEHPVTEETCGVDLVEWMLRLAQGDDTVLDTPRGAAGAAVEARVYAEDPTQGHRPSAGLVTSVRFPDDVRVDGWVEAGTEVSTSYDPMLAKVIVTGATRDEAYAKLRTALAATRVDGIETNLGLLRAAAADESVLAARHCTATLAGVHDAEPRIVVERPGTLTAVQDWPGRTGLWEVGVPPSGPMDDLSFRLGNRALGNPEGAPGLECTVDGPALRFTAAAQVCVTGAAAPVTVDGVPVPRWTPVHVPAERRAGRRQGRRRRAAQLHPGRRRPRPAGVPGQRRHLHPRPVRRPRRAHPAPRRRPAPPRTHRAGRRPGALDQRPSIGRDWRIAVTEGPHAAPEFFLREDIDAFYAAQWQVHFNSARTGVRLVGPKPRWARTDGGEAGLHPSNIHDTPYSVGAVDFTGDVPILLGPDGPSLGGFVCPATVITAERWKLGQLSPGDTVRFVPVSDDTALRLRARPLAPVTPLTTGDDGVLARREHTDTAPAVTYRRSGDDNLLVEYGPMTLDLGLRMRGHALMDRLRAEGLPGVVDLTPGIRSLQIHVDPGRLPVRRLLGLVREIEDELPATRELAVPSRTVHLPLSWDDPATREAIARYMAGCPRRRTLVPVEHRVHPPGQRPRQRRRRLPHRLRRQLPRPRPRRRLPRRPGRHPLDPRHRLVTTKYNPARTWTPENAVGIGGAYLCVYGMEGPGGYQFVGRTVQVWNRWRREPGDPWLLRHFDRISWYPVGAEELLDLRADVAAGRHRLRIDEGTFRLADHEDFLAANAASIADFRAAQAAAFGQEREAWAAAGEFDPRPEPEAPPARRRGDRSRRRCADRGAVHVQRVAHRRAPRRPGHRRAAAARAGGHEAGECGHRTAGRRGRRRPRHPPGSQVAPGSPLLVLAGRTTA
nr:urea carboxylase [Actinoplanes digitatis]